MLGSPRASTAIERAAAPLSAEWNKSSPSELVELDQAWTEDVFKVCRRIRPPIELWLRGEKHALQVVRGPGSLSDQPAGIYIGLAGQRVGDTHCTARFELYGVVFVLDAQLHGVDPDTVLCTDTRLFCLDRRSVARQSLQPGRAELEWSYVENDELRVGSGTVRDLTPDSVGIIPFDTGAPLPPRTFTALLRVGDTSIPCIARTLRRIGEAGHAIAVSLYASSKRETMVRAYLGEHLPRLVARQELDPEAMGKLMLQSGYLALRQSAAELDAWSRLRPRDLLSSDCVYRAADGALLGHLSATQIYRRTWLWHQLACLIGHAESGEARLELYLMGAIVPALHHGLAANTLAYFNQDHRWHRLFFSQYVSWLNDPSAATICSFDRFERDALPAEPEALHDYELRSASEQELLQVAMLVRSYMPDITADAMDIHPAELRHGGYGSRGREVFVLVEQGVVVGAALCEQGDPNISLFNLLNMAQIYLRSGNRRPSPSAQRALLARARRFYSELGIATPMLVSPSGTLERDVEPGTQWVESMGCVVVSGRGLRQFENFCRFHFGRRWRRHARAPELELDQDKPEARS